MKPTITESTMKNGMNFGLAIEALKRGEKVARKGWNGKGMYLFLISGDDLTDALCEVEDGVPPCESSVCMKTAQNTFVIGWLASQTDMLAEDWLLVDAQTTAD